MSALPPKPWWISRWFRVLLALALLAAVAVGWALQGPDSYRWESVIFGLRYHRYDDFITQAAQRYGVDPALVKAVIWRESKFRPEMRGTAGERGLMQVTEGAAKDWARAEKIETFVPEDLWDPKNNIEVGTWYLARAMRHWASRDNPVPFALAEYNAGRTRVNRWKNDSGLGEGFHAEELQAQMDFPGTRRYIEVIETRYREFLKSGEFSEVAGPHSTK